MRLFCALEAEHQPGESIKAHGLAALRPGPSASTTTVGVCSFQVELAKKHSVVTNGSSFLGVAFTPLADVILCLAAGRVFLPGTVGHGRTPSGVCLYTSHAHLW